MTEKGVRNWKRRGDTEGGAREGDGEGCEKLDRIERQRGETEKKNRAGRKRETKKRTVDL